MKGQLIIIFIWLMSLHGYAQYPFELCPAIKYKTFTNWKEKKDTTVIKYKISIPNFFKDSTECRVQLTNFIGNDSLSYIDVYKHKNRIQHIKLTYSLGNSIFDYKIEPETQKLYVEDLNGDGLNDIKLIVPGNGSCGAYNFYLAVYYFIQKQDGHFQIICFTDLMMDYLLRPERDINGDGNYEIITQTFKNVEPHNYWVFNLYDYDGKKLVNVNYLDDYPIMGQILYKGSHVETNKIPRKNMKAYSMKLPDGYELLAK